jgi:hypothetical protein
MLQSEHWIRPRYLQNGAAYGFGLARPSIVSSEGRRAPVL